MHLPGTKDPGLSGPRTHLSSVKLAPPPSGLKDRFPFSVPSIKGLDSLAFPSPVTVFVGENGSGKSTLLEALALATKLPTVGLVESNRDPTLEAQRALAKTLTLVWHARSHRGFFLRAEDFFGFTHRLASLQDEMRARIQEVQDGYEGATEHTKGLAAGPAAASLAEIRQRYGANLDANSHGESFLKLFESRLVPGGLFLLDEPEAALSPQSQLALLAMMNDQVAQGGQFVLATHSPILMAIPGATIYDFDQSPLVETPFDELASVGLLRSFLEAPNRFLRHLWTEG